MIILSSIERELKEINNLIKENDILVIYGSPGDGKTKLALETINSFVKIMNTTHFVYQINMQIYLMIYINTSKKIKNVFYLLMMQIELIDLGKFLVFIIQRKKEISRLYLQLGIMLIEIL